MSSSFTAFDDVGYQAVMLADKVRMEAFTEAIRRVVRPGDIVVDVGTGSGVLAALAAKAGARRVYALERGPMAELAKGIAEANGLSNRMVVWRGDAREFEFPEPPTVLLCEMLGNFGPDEDILAMVRAVSKRCAPGVRIMPRSFEIELAALWDGNLAQELRAIEEVGTVTLRPLRERYVHRVTVTRLAPDDVVAGPIGTGRLVLGESEHPEQLSAALPVRETCSINAVGAWFVAQLGAGVELSTSPFKPQTHWQSLRFPVFPPLSCHAGDVIQASITPRFFAGRYLWAWQVTVGESERSGDLVHAATGGKQDLLAHLRIAFSGQGGPKHKPSERLESWAAILEGRVEGDIGAMTERLLRERPGKYAGHSDAQREVLALLRAAEALE